MFLISEHKWSLWKINYRVCQKIILNRILSRLQEKDRARKSVLSKAWLDTWYTFPILSFSDSKILGLPQAKPIEDSVRKRKTLEFCDYVKRRMLKFRDQSLTIKEFKLNVLRLELHHISKDINILVEIGVEVIEYSQWVGHSQYHYYALPMCVIEAKSLTKLVLEGFIKIDPIFTNHSIKFFSLRELSLRHVLLVDEHAINHLISFCHLIEYITLDSCKVLSSGGGTREPMKSLRISGLQKLKSVDVSGIKYVSIDASSLENLCYSPGNQNYGVPSIIDIDRCRNFKELFLRSVASTFFTNKWFLELFPKFPFLESLKLENCEIPERIDISSVRLKRLETFYRFHLLHQASKALS
ncbi:hypothetical protein MTR_6g006740 [Medicago truncatula]|uniref:F-box/LRR-repeat protein 15/At3g58940/PEG3-like LRR domain-containing protein n=1 Tax=Medicago truncatula TaxID=3880 RepID=G7KI76_MEDTR|nr:hypothetical protein MTR_6g006740 [Medicago truncatula]